jgi:hypothetical protein
MLAGKSIHCHIDSISTLMGLQKQIAYNRCLTVGGRKLLKAINVPLSLWSLVFERAVKMLRWGSFADGRKKAQADVIYYLLQGPALFERQGQHIMSE